MGRFEAVLFDLDGTLVDTEPLVVDCMVRTVQAGGYPLTEELLLANMGPPLPELLDVLFSVRGAEAQAIYDAYLETYEREYMPRTAPLPGAADLITRLRELEVRLAIVTNKRAKAGRQALEVVGWSEQFALVVGNDTAEAAKPDAAPLRFALEALGSEPARAAMIGDTETDMGAGVAAGVAAVIGVRGVRDHDRLRAAGATATAEDLMGVGDLLLAG